VQQTTCVIEQELSFKTYYGRKDIMKNGNDGEDEEEDVSRY
jgi:hypothetical protein